MNNATADPETESRPAFRNNINKARKTLSSELAGYEEYDMAHRLSYHDINKIVMYSPEEYVESMIEAVTVPQRDFGTKKKGDKEYYNETMKLYQKGDRKKLISHLNSSPYNLRPGVPSINRSIGKRADLHHLGNDPKRSLTPQSKRLEHFAISLSDKSSDFLKPGVLKSVEKVMTEFKFKATLSIIS